MLTAFVDALQFKVYNDSYREECSHRRTNGTIIERPDWSMASIRRHLLFTTNESGNSTVFDDYVTQTLQVRHSCRNHDSGLLTRGST